ncbi:hypothetical protein A3E73_00070 [Candidatus Beckwithbacteria bacterium RIFCSPHIGHO2_12_FULL_47_17]|uniref:Uncharacterized protein n=1 Tax=Candidatus Beckwithbacteria bacterium RIFCSPHIGHO2_12_FULL_47_17 TaxID=1797460 RepID=A0A1F5DMV1_9BACT|nr:MAG: hypothetical protein A3E73_00070 [Candidatus Beckwithbacteria bacterium RIFCSPHIGHO2_12_FULL_47_17]
MDKPVDLGMAGDTINQGIGKIGGEAEMTYPHIREDLKPKIKSIVVKEFQGIDHLPEKLQDLLK